jgi:hypothetical protein
MSHSREIRTFATEVKFLVDPSVAGRIRDWARTHLEADPHGTGRFRDEYVTTSVYFDTPQFDVFHRHGSFGRSKYRIRRYGEADVVFLERKLREPTVLAKRRTATALADLERLDTDSAAESWPGRWFQARLAARRLQPVCQVAYRRTARLLRDSEDIVRLTLDDALSAQPLRSLRFRPGPGVPALPGQQILELKFRHHTPAIFKQLVEEFGLIPQRASKYRLGMAASGLAPAEATERTRVEAARGDDRVHA